MPDPADSGGLVLDTSVWINLLATEAIEAILGALAVPCHAPEQVVAELRRHPVSGAAFHPERHPLRAMAPAVVILSLEGPELDLFLEIVGAPAVDALGDGEAAAIAVAALRGLDLVIDDRKARRILRDRFSTVRTWWTVDLLRAGRVIASLGRARAEDCFEKARRFGRMHVPGS
ncbi:MAG TPA: PIN domain-containing protein [Caulobacteraceae bacterium]|nr:PIN domain-containing protein [Caulobacteraceae bacterium]